MQNSFFLIVRLLMGTLEYLVIVKITFQMLGLRWWCGRLLWGTLEYCRSLCLKPQVTSKNRVAIGHCRCERVMDDPNSNGKCVQTDQFCQHTRMEFLNSRHNTGKAYWKYNAAKRKADQLKKTLKTIAAHYSSLKNNLKECDGGKFYNFPQCWSDL